MPRTEENTPAATAQQQPLPTQPPEIVPPANPELREPSHPQSIFRKQELQLELQQREMQEMRYLSEQQKAALDQQKTELTELKEQFARLLNQPPLLTQPPHNINYVNQPPNEFQAYIASNPQYNVPNTSSFQPFSNSFVNQQGRGPPP
ncbi:MAG: hypothetical protein GY820_32080, partial [Gammaproteobacteria bacterium]|nr:hypothetical protein [Gammaproteobacteria bacterium]